MESFLAGRASVPKTPSPGSSSSAATNSAAAVSSAMNMEAFESLFAVSSAGNGDSTAAGALADAAACQKTPGGGAPNVEVVRENGTVRRVIITCGCGERIELECDY